MSTSSTSANNNRSKAKRLRMALVAGLALLSAVSLASLMVRVDGFPAEVSVRIECARLMLSGKIPYIDFFVLDAPWILLIQLAPAKVAQLLHLTGYNLARCTLVFEWIVSVASLTLTSMLILRRPHLRDSLTCRSLLLTFAFLNIAATYQFGQTEHYLMLGFVPYAIARWLEYAGRRLRPWENISCGITGGAAAILDPLFGAAFIAWELFLMAQFMRLAVKPFGVMPTAILTATLMTVLLWLAQPAMMHNYADFILPLQNADRLIFDMRLYGYVSVPDMRPAIYLLIVATVLVQAIPRRSSLTAPLLVLGWIGLAYFVTECKGYSFQILPTFWVTAFALSIMLTSMLSDLYRAIRKNGLTTRFKISAGLRPAWLVIALIAASTVCALYVQNREMNLADTASQRLRGFEFTDIPDISDEIKVRTVEGDGVLVMNNCTAPAYPTITLQNRKPGSRLMWGFPFPILERMRFDMRVNQTERERLEKFYYSILKEDLSNNPPALITVQDGTTEEGLRRMEIMKLIDAHYTVETEANFFSDNLAPKEYSDCSYVSRVFVLAL
jgi:hypothetical protein